MKSCTAIQIVHSHSIELQNVHTPQPPKADSTTLGHFIRRLFSSGNLCSRIPALRSRKPSLSLPHTSYHSKLTRLDLNTEFLLIPQLATFTLAVMKHSPIISLSLSPARNSIFDKSTFKDHTFPQIIAAVPRLQEIRLALGQDTIFPSILRNLAGLSNLKTMVFRLTRSSEIRSSEFSSRDLVFPEFLSFTGSLDQATHLFGRIKACPKLGFVNVVVDHHFTQPRWQTIVDRFQLLNSYFSVLRINPRVSLCLSNRSERLAFRGDVDLLDIASKAMCSISNLTLELPNFSETDPESRLAAKVQHVRGWVDLAHGLGHLTVTTWHRRREDMDLDATLRDVINAECPQLSAVNVVNLHNAFHYHWSNAREGLERGIDGIPGMNIPRNKAPMDSTYACFNF